MNELQTTTRRAFLARAAYNVAISRLIAVVTKNPSTLHPIVKEAMGWSARNGSGAEDGRFVPPTFKKKSTKFNVMKPIRFAGLDSGSNVSPFESIDPTPGTLLLFPSCK